jgi:uncharacterized protein (TIGR03085 family)
MPLQRKRCAGGRGYGGVVSLARAERAALSDTLDRTDPHQPTLCAGWTARDLLAHLLVRERQPWASGGIVIPFLAPLTERAMQGYADTAWKDMVEQLRSGPPAWSPSRIGRVDEAVNGAELFVHHEDVRRGRPGWEPRGADETRDGALWELVTRMGRLFYRRSPVGVVVRRPTGAQAVIKTGRGLVTIEGEPGEILLHAFGRDAARVELRGQPADVDALAGSARGA